jgi:drug/metabolite transporter (DMT)-like permease
MSKDIRKAYIALGIVCFFWGTTYVAARVGAQQMPGLFVAGVRQFLSGLILVSFFVIRGYKFPDWKEIKQISIQGFFLLCVANGGLTWAMEYITGGLAAIIVALVPIFIALFSTWLSKSTRITRWMIVGLVVGFAGVLVIFYDYLGQPQHKGFLFGVMLSLISVLSWSFGTVYTSKQKSSIGILYNVGLQMLIAGVIMLIVCAVTGKYVNLGEAATSSWVALIYLIIFGSLIAYSAYVFAISKLPTTLVSIYAYINPVVAVILGWLILAEKMNLNMILGTVITLAGVYLVNREYKKQKI